MLAESVSASQLLFLCSVQPWAAFMSCSGWLLLPTLTGILARPAFWGRVCYQLAGALLAGRGPGCRAHYKINYSVLACELFYVKVVRPNRVSVLQ